MSVERLREVLRRRKSGSTFSNIPHTTCDACNYPLPNTGLASLPVEIIARVLEFVTPREIGLFQRICRIFCDAVQISVTLQYKIECFLCGVSEESDSFPPEFSIRDKYEHIKEWSSAWKRFDYHSHTTTTVSSAGATVVADGIGVMRFNLFADMVISIPHSHYRGICFRETSVRFPGAGATGLPANGYTYNTASNVLLSTQYDSVTQNVHLQLDPIFDTNVSATFGAHRLTLVPRAPVSEGSYDTWFNLAGNSAFLFGHASGSGNGDIWAVNWRRGLVIKHLHGDFSHIGDVYGPNKSGCDQLRLDIDSTVMFDESLCIVPAARGDTFCLGIFNILEAGYPDSVGFDDAFAEAELFLELPKLSTGLHYYDMRMLRRPNSSHLSKPLSSSSASPGNHVNAKGSYLPFFTGYSARTLTCLHTMIRGESLGSSACLLHFLLPDDAVHRLLQISRTKGTPCIAWREWGHETRVFQAPMFGGSSYLYGSRYVTREDVPDTAPDGPSPSSQSGQTSNATFSLVIYDFDSIPSMIRDAGSGAYDLDHFHTSRSNMSLPLDESELSVLPAAPYRRIPTGVRVGLHDMEYLGEDFMMVERCPADAVGNRTMDMYTF